MLMTLTFAARGFQEGFIKDLSTKNATFLKGPNFFRIKANKSDILILKKHERYQNVFAGRVLKVRQIGV